MPTLWPNTYFKTYSNLTFDFAKIFSRAGNSLIGFPRESIIFFLKLIDSLIRSFLVSNLSDSLTIPHFLWAPWANCSWSLIFCERPEQFAHIACFWWATWAIHSHRSPNEKEISDLLIFSIIFLKIIQYIKHIKNKILDFLSQNLLSESLICSFPLSDLRESLTVAHLSWATWAIHSRRSFPLSNLSVSLMVAHLSKAIWANRSQSLIWFERNEQMNNERMSEFPALIFSSMV